MTELARLTDVRGPDHNDIIAAAFLAAYQQPTRAHYTLIVRQWYQWCAGQNVRPMAAQRAHIELWARQLSEVHGLQASTITGKIGCVKKLYDYAVMDGYLPANPAQWVRRPSVPRQSTTNGLTRPELLAILNLAQKSSVQDHAIVCVLGLNGIRVGELCAVDIEDVGRQGGYHTLAIIREKSREPAVIPLAPRTSWAVEQQMYGRKSGPLFLIRGEERADRRAIDRVVKRLARQVGVTKRISPHSFRHTFITLGLEAGVSVRNMRNSVGHNDDRMIAYYDRARESLTQNATHMVSAFVES